ncbi:GyrI-like domain-containing protein [Chloroflexota bacterium]
MQINVPIEVIERSAQSTAAIRTRASVNDLPGLLPRAYEELIRYLNGLNIPVSDPAYAYAAYYNMDMDDLDVEAGFPIDSQVEGSGDIMAGEIPGGRFATTIHTGPYDEMQPIYERPYDWIRQNGHEPAGAVYELYLNGPDNTPPKDLLARILIPLK